VAFPLHPEIPEQGLSLEELFAGRAFDVRVMSLRLRRAAEELGLPLGERTKTFNTRLAQELAKWAEGQGRGDEYHQAAFRACFVEGTNIGKPDELLDLAASIGLPRDEARRIIERRFFREAVDADWARSRDLGITGVPTFVMRDKRVVGAQPYEMLERFVKGCGTAKRRP
jgi:predicted DsbA family dithiol-disulfide isomerase